MLEGKERRRCRRWKARGCGWGPASHLIQIIWRSGEGHIVDDDKFNVTVFAPLPCHMHNCENGGSADSGQQAAMRTFH